MSGKIKYCQVGLKRSTCEVPPEIKLVRRHRASPLILSCAYEKNLNAPPPPERGVKTVITCVTCSYSRWERDKWPISVHTSRSHNDKQTQVTEDKGKGKDYPRTDNEGPKGE